MSFKQLTKTIGGTISNNSPTILTGLSVAGLLTTTFMAVKATPKAMRILEEERNIREKESNYKKIEPIKTKDTVILTWKCYLPAALMGAATIGCIIGANSINLRRNAALAGAYSLTEKALKEYQSKVVETIGEAKERKIKDDIAQDRVNNNPVSGNEVIVTGKGETLCFDSFSGRYFKSDMETIKRALNEVSRRLMNDMQVSMNEVYNELGLEGSKMGDVMGWHVDNGLIEPRFTSTLSDDGRPCLVLDFDVEPMAITRDY